MTVETHGSGLVRRLLHMGREPQKGLVEAILAAGPAARPALVAMAVDYPLLNAPEPACWGPLHALYLLCALQSPEAVEALLDQLKPEVQERDLPRLMDLWLNSLSMALACPGVAALPSLRAVAQDAGRPPLLRELVVMALPYLVYQSPEARDEVVALARATLAESNEPFIVAQMVRVLAYLGVAGAYAEVMAAYRARRVNSQLFPPGAARQGLLAGALAPHLACVAHPIWERYAQHPLRFPDEHIQE